MITKKYLKLGFLPIAMMLCGVVFTSCADDIEAGKAIDEGAYDAVNRVDGMLLDANTNKNESVIELRSDKHQTDVYFSLSQQPKQGVDVKIAFDAAYLEKYNAAHGTNFALYPAENVTIAGDGAVLLAPDEKRSLPVGVTLTDPKNLEEDVTYAIPLTATSLTTGITLSESASHTIYLVNSKLGESDTFKGEGAMKTVLYFEVNDTNPLNALEFVLKDSGKLFFDEIVLFSANINYDQEKGRVYVLNNPNVQFLLDNNEQYLQPLRKRGMKVILCILGNWDQAGVAQLSTVGAKMFAQELAAYCRAYNLDGVGFDDEYSAYPDLTNPLFASPSPAAAGRLLFETKKTMPEKTVMAYYLKNLNSSVPAVDGFTPDQFVDYVVADYGLAAAPMMGMTLKDCAGMSIQLNSGAGNAAEATARSKKQAGYGYYMFYALGGTTALTTEFSKYKTQIGRCQTVCKGLYEQELLAPEYYYKKNDTKRYLLP